MGKARKIISLVAWIVPLLTVVAAGALCWRYVGVHESGIVEIGTMVLAILLMVAGVTVALAVNGIAQALLSGEGRKP